MNFHSLLKTVIFTTIFCGCGITFAEQNFVCKDIKNLDAENVSLEQLMEIPIFLGASQQAACTNEAANIVNSISSEQILTSGARDLTDILQLVPGFTIGMNIYGIASMGLRGVSADEGKMSVFVDGIMLTEQIFSSTGMGGRFPIEQIDRIEIIRGSSSILNGNFAEMGMINIITKNAKKAEGIAVTTNYGRFERGEARKNISMSAGKIFDDLEISFSGKANESQRSDRIYTDAHGNSFDMMNNSHLDSLYGNLNFKYKELNLRLLSEEYNVQSRDGLSDSIESSTSYFMNRFTTHAAKLDFEHPFNSNFKLNSTFDFSRQTPWESSTHFDDGKLTNVKPASFSDHYKLNTKATWMTDAGSYLAVGNSYQMDNYSLATDKTLFWLTDYSAYLEGVYKTDWADILAGVRFDSYNRFGTNFAPRVALTKQLDKFHYKLLYTHAFHAPTLGNTLLNIDYNRNNTLGRHVNDAIPELAQTYEIELGYAFSPNLEIVANVFYTQIDNIFTYQLDEHWNGYYGNAKVEATDGVEATVKYNDAMLGRFDLNYSFYQAAKSVGGENAYKAMNTNKQVVYPNMNLGFPTHKATLNHTFNFTSDFAFNHSLIFFSDRLGYNGAELTHYKPDWIYNAYLRYQNMPIKGAEIGLGLYDVFNARYQYVQQFNSGHPALPVEARELMLRLSYKF